MPSSRPALCLLLAASLWAALGAAATIAQTSAPSSGQASAQDRPVLRGQQTSDIPAPAPAPQVRAPLMTPLSPAAPRFGWDSAPRLRGYSQDDAPGQCRRACTTSYFQCSGDDAEGNCSRAWVQCLTGCPA